MTIHYFDIYKGIYDFEMHDIHTTNHAHPVVEVIIAIKGTFSLKVNKLVSENLVFAIVDANVKHQFSSQDCQVKTLMVESHNNMFSEYLIQSGIILSNRYYTSTTFPEKEQFYTHLKEFALKNDLKTPSDTRIAKCLDIITHQELTYETLIPSLRDSVFLSESRLSHLFKEHIGVSIKKYLVWHNLKRAIHSYLQNNNTLTEASLEHGFFDQAHLSNAFKNVLGVPPSKAYNSRTVQF